MKADPAQDPVGPRWVLHPALISAAFVLDVALANKIEPAGFMRSLVIAILAGLTLTLVLWGIVRDRWLGGLMASALIVISITFIPAYYAWEALLPVFGSGAPLVVGVAVFVIFAVPLVQLARARRGHRLIRRPATAVLNQFSAVLVVVVVVLHAGPDLPGTVAALTRTEPHIAVSPAIADLPDIYVILLDGYPRADVLSRRFGIDNSSFLDALGKLGFDVASRNHSNYPLTQLTLASIFQMRHLEDIASLRPLIGESGQHVNALRDALNNGPAFSALHAAGYEIVTTPPGYEHATLRDLADRVLDAGTMNDMERETLKRTWLIDLIGNVHPEVFSRPLHDRILNEFDDIGVLAGEHRDRPIFAWIHIPAPHLPLVIAGDGSALVLEPRRFNAPAELGFGMTAARFRSTYAAELSYLNARTISAIHQLQAAQGKTAPVIIVMSDHGYTYDLNDVAARLSNLFAASTPQIPGLLANGPTPVNLMPILLNGYLGTDFELSPDRYFLIPSGDQLLELTEVPNPDTIGGDG